MKWIRMNLRRFFFTLLLMGGIFFILIATESGSLLVVKTIARFIPGKLTIGEMRGKLINHVDFRKINYAKDGLHLAIGSIHTRWSPLSLLKLKMQVQELKAKNIYLHLPKADHLNGPVNLTRFIPILNHVVINNLAVKDMIIFSQNNQLVNFNEISLHKNRDLSESLKVNSDKGRIEGKIILSNVSSFNWSIDLLGKDINLDNIVLMPSKINFALKSFGTWEKNNKQLGFHLNALTGHLDRYPVNADLDIHFNNGKLEIKKSHVHIDDAYMQVVGERDQKWNMHWELSVPDLNKLIANSKGHLSMEGAITGFVSQPHMSMQMAAKNIHIKDTKIASLTAKANTLSDVIFIEGSGENIDMNGYLSPKLQLKANSKYVKNQLMMHLTLFANANNKAYGTISLPQYSSFMNSQQPIQGKMIIDIANLNDILTKTPEIKSLHGRVQGNVDLTGRIEAPIISYRAQLSEGYFFIKQLGIGLTNVKMNSTYQSQGPILFSGNFNSGEGEGAINGSVSIHNAPTDIRINLVGSNLQLANTNEYKISISPNLNLTYRNKKMDVTGEVAVPKARITPNDFSSVVTLPKEVVILGKKQIPVSSPLNLALNIKILLGNEVHLKYENLRARLGGELAVTQVIGSPEKVVGILSVIEGKYKAYDNLLKIENGRLTYAGNTLMNPGLDIRATKKIKTVEISSGSNQLNNDKITPAYTGRSTLTVGIWVRGTAASPIVTLFSDPFDLSQNDILSYLIFGYPQSKINSKSSLSILSALASNINLGGGNVSGGAEKIRKKLGLSELSVSSTELFNPNADPAKGNITSNVTTFNVGKKLGRHLYLRYSVGVFDPIQILNLKYQITKRLAIQSETSSLDNGADIVYELEKD